MSDPWTDPWPASYYVSWALSLLFIVIAFVLSVNEAGTWIEYTACLVVAAGFFFWWLRVRERMGLNRKPGRY